ncbi:MAG TPA: hypothetical protein VFV99_09395 [Kofleriaceae bacterium]|nr:hypothetical protein [Kofleriaceae bacterium]
MLNGVDMMVTPYDPVTMRFWQLVTTGSVLHLNYSRDAVHWVELTSTDRGTDDLTAADLAFGAGRFGQTATGITTFDNLNLCP